MRLLFLLLIFLMTVSASAASEKFMNVKFSALGSTIGLLDLDLDFAVSENWTLGPTLLSWRRETTDPNFYGPLSLTISGLGLRGTYFSDGRLKTGFYLSPIVEAISAEAKGVSLIGRSISGTTSGLVIEALAGIHWFFGVFNLSLGGGASWTLGAERIHIEGGVTSQDVKVEDRQPVALAIELMVGAAF